MPQVRIDLIPMGDRIIVTPIDPDREHRVGNLIIEKSEQWKEREEWENSLGMVIRCGPDAPESIQPGDDVLVAKDLVTKRRMRIGSEREEVVIWICAPGHILLKRVMTPIPDDVVAEDVEAVGN